MTTGHFPFGRCLSQVAFLLVFNRTRCVKIFKRNKCECTFFVVLWTQSRFFSGWFRHEMDQDNFGHFLSGDRISPHRIQTQLLRPFQRTTQAKRSLLLRKAANFLWQAQKEKKNLHTLSANSGYLAPVNTSLQIGTENINYRRQSCSCHKKGFSRLFCVISCLLVLCNPI